MKYQMLRLARYPETLSDAAAAKTGKRPSREGKGRNDPC
jgi:hypothetical protein